MKKYTLIACLMILFLIIASVMIILKLHLSNYLSVLFLLLFFPFLIYRGINLAFKSSLYIKKYHPSFYHQYKSITLGTQGNIVNLMSVSDKEITELQDPKILILKNEITRIIQLIFACFVSFIFLCILTIAVI